MPPEIAHNSISPSVPDPISGNPRPNIAEIIKMEEEAVASRTTGERISDVIARYAGTIEFISAHAVWFTAWIVLNAGIVPGIKRFDPFPYPFLTFVVSLEAIFLSLFILVSQNRSNRHADARSHLDLQINMLAEQESTKMLEMLQSLCEHHKLAVAHDPDVDSLKSPTKPAELLKELKDNLPNSN